MDKYETMAQIGNLMDAARKLALDYIESEVRKILAEHDCFESFIMGMGSWSFLLNNIDHNYQEYFDKYIADSDLNEFMQKQGETLGMKWSHIRIFPGQPTREW